MLEFKKILLIILVCSLCYSDNGFGQNHIQRLNTTSNFLSESNNFGKSFNDSTKINSILTEAGNELVKSRELFILGHICQIAGGFLIYNGVKNDEKDLISIGVMSEIAGLFIFYEAINCIGKAGEKLKNINNNSFSCVPSLTWDACNQKSYASVMIRFKFYLDKLPIASHR